MSKLDYKKPRTLKELYWSKGLSQKKIADKYGVCRKTISYWMNKHGVETRKHKKYVAGSFDFHDGYARFRTQVDGESKQVRIHRLVAVAEHGFDAVKDKVVHHKNGVKWDNRPSNLELMKATEHTIMHNRERDFCISEYASNAAEAREARAEVEEESL